MKVDALREFEGKEITIIVQNLSRPCGGTLVALDDSFITIKPNSGRDNILLIPTDKVLSIMHHRGTDNEQIRKSN
jgi:hypothetical protein